MKIYDFKPVEQFDALKDDHNFPEQQMHLSRYQLVVNNIIKTQNESATVLDAACGTGYGSFIIQKNTKTKVIGIDISENSIKHAQANYANKNIIFKLADIKTIPYKDNLFDYIACFETIEHVNFVEGVKIIKEFYRVLKPGGYLFISSSNKYYTSILNMVGFKNPFHFHEYYPVELENVLIKHGFLKTGQWGQGFIFSPIYFLARAKKKFAKYFYPQKYIPLASSMYFIYSCRKQ